MTIGITGANGFVGRHLLRTFTCRGYRAVGFVRRTECPEPGVESRYYEMESGLSASDLSDIDILIHGAFIRNSSANKDSTERNIRATCVLYHAAIDLGIDFVFLSTLSARPDAQSEYGIHKYATEAALRTRKAIIVRPGLVVGDGGLIRSLYASLRSGVVPLVDGGRQRAQVIGVEDLATAILLARQHGLRGSHAVCAADAVSISTIATTMATHFQLKARFISIPWPAAYAAAAVAENIGLVLPVTTENLLGMRSVVREEPSATLTGLGWRARPWNELLEGLSFEQAR